MAVYIVTGKLGSGKTLAMVGRIREYINEGRPVATNIDLNLGVLCSKPPRASVVRVSDRPTPADLDAIGSVDTGGQEAKNGALVLDECGTWLNSRTWADKSRQLVIDWMLHSRKRGWDVFLIVQNINLIDKQIRDALAEYTVNCRRLDRLKIPFLGSIIEGLSLGYASGKMPQIHMASVVYGSGLSGIPADRWVYRGRDLWGAYATAQIVEIDAEAGPYSMIHPAKFAAPPGVRKLKPKRPEVAAVMSMPEPLRIAWLRRRGAALAVGL